jgi:hypothetical protein
MTRSRARVVIELIRAIAKSSMKLSRASLNAAAKADV